MRLGAPSVGQLNWSSAGQYRFRNAVLAECTKILTLPRSWIAFVSAFTANVLLSLLATDDVIRLAGRHGAVPLVQLGTLMLSPVYLFLAIAVVAAGSEYRTGQLRVSLTVVPERRCLFAAKLLATAMLCWPAAVVVILPGYLAQQPLAAITAGVGIGTSVLSFAAYLVTYSAAYLLLALIGFGFAILSRSITIPLAVLFTMPLLASPLIERIAPNTTMFLPHEAALSLLAMPTAGVALGRIGGLSALLLWTMLFVAAAWVGFVRRDS